MSSLAAANSCLTSGRCLSFVSGEAGVWTV
ncbi:Protein of unknown function [Pyronema omphalodes CBS 100304]|uniref:Uncharacterized protein n=1 Tax=Pyronema omphalodes (strain CBS 100304) TaxID=1076935 RepID=U4LAD1_PYROM|nr:Protein of unknown function [Pyronema omphalodes CBS 100304]